MPDRIIYHNPKCTKSRQTLALLHKNNVDIQIVEYLKTPPSVTEIKEILKKLNLRPLDIIRSKESRFKELGLTRDSQISNSEWIKIIHQNPELIERPIVLLNNKAVLGRPPENVLNII